MARCASGIHCKGSKCTFLERCNSHRMLLGGIRYSFSCADCLCRTCNWSFANPVSLRNNALVRIAFCNFTNCCSAPAYSISNSTNLEKPIFRVGNGWGSDTAAIRWRCCSGGRVFCIFLLQRDRSIFTRFSFAFIYGFISSFPTFVWLSRNLYLSGKLAGERFPGAFEFGEILSQAFATVGIMFLPSQLIDYAVVAGVLILLTALSTPVLVYVRYRDNSRLLNSSIVLALFVLAYSVFIVYIATQTNTCCVDRFEGVIFPLLVMQGCFLLHTQFRRNSRFFAKSLLFACFLWLLVPTSQSISIASEYPLATPARHAKNFPILMNFSFPEGALVSLIDLISCGYWPAFQV